MLQAQTFKVFDTIAITFHDVPPFVPQLHQSSKWNV